MNKIIDQGEAISLSSADLLKICEGQVNVHTYGSLGNLSSYEELFRDGKSCIVLYETRQGYGHWVCLIQYQNYVEFFDPLGWRMDTELSVIDDHFRLVLGETVPHLSSLLSGIRVISNTTPLQKESQFVNTCGRHCAVRIRFRNYEQREYLELFKKQKYTPDQLVTLLTYFF
jgi:hypothetical protein